jgi:hypothetical protein
VPVDPIASSDNSSTLVEVLGMRLFVVAGWQEVVAVGAATNKLWSLCLGGGVVGR